MARRLRIEADGGSRGNPGIAGYGALVREESSGEVLAERAGPLGKASNNVAEYTGLIRGLDAVLAIDPAATVLVAMDSKLVVEQMSGRWKIKHEDMRRLALEAGALVDQIRDAGGRVTYQWIPRAQNSAADKLSNDGMDGKTVCRGAGCDDVTPPAPAPTETARRTDVTSEPTPTSAAPPEWGEPTRIVLVRHGVTDFTESMRLDGRGGSDPSLNEVGRRQAANAARLVADLVAGGPVTLTTSTLARAKETGAAIAAAVDVQPLVDDAWDEQSFGDWDGRAVAELFRDHRHDVAALRTDPTYARPGGESHEQLVERVRAAYERLVEAGGTHIVVCHRKPIMVVLGGLLGLPLERGWRISAAPGSLTGVEAWPGGVGTVAFTNRT